MKVAIICGGPSMERGISLNSARSVLDHLEGDGIEIVPFYFDAHKKPYKISTAELYSNTPSDFDFKLHEKGKKLTQNQLIKELKKTDIVFPIMHGPFGEDGQIQSLLEANNIPFIGSDSKACIGAFDKYGANKKMSDKGFHTLPAELLKIGQDDENKKKIDAFFRKHKLKRAIVKPTSGGSSLGVYSVTSAKDALEKVNLLFKEKMDTRVVLEPFCEGIEFTVIILQNNFGMPVGIIPTEIETEYRDNQIFDYRKKYLPTKQVRYHCPPRFDIEVIEKIQTKGEQIFDLFGMRDFARFDGWLLPDGKIWFSDLNPISGMEQNSFLFQQSARVGLSHRDIFKYIIKRACKRESVTFDAKPDVSSKKKKRINVIFGGSTSERQVSLMSGTNAWLKLRRSHKYDPRPFLLDMNNNVWELPYALTLNHTVEEIYENAIGAAADEEKLKDLSEKVRLKLTLSEGESTEEFFLPKQMSLADYIDQSNFSFLGLHGGDGEDGTIQAILEKKNVKFNGPGSQSSKICSDKHQTGIEVEKINDSGIMTAPKRSYRLNKFMDFKDADYKQLWKDLLDEFGGETIIVKPQGDGCSSGIVRLYSVDDLKLYISLFKKGIVFISPNMFKNQTNIIEMPQTTPERILFEKFIETDIVRVNKNKLSWKRKTGWIEITCGVLEEKGKIRAFNPSITVAEGEVLSLEEKFQGGTGINITPPPSTHVDPKLIEKVKKSFEKVAKALKITSYSRIDAFMNIDDGQMIIIEANTLPGITPSTVLFQQALAEDPAITPRELFEKIIDNRI